MSNSLTDAQLGGLASHFANRIKASREPADLAEAREYAAREITKLNLSEAQLKLLLDEIGYLISPMTRPLPGPRMILDHDVRAFMQVLAEVRAKLAPAPKKS